MYTHFFYVCINVILNISQDEFPVSFWSQAEGAQGKHEAELDEFPGPLRLCR